MALSSQIIVDRYKWLKTQLATDPPLSMDLIRVVVESLHDLSSEPSDVTYQEVNCPGSVKPGIWCKPFSADSSRVILYLHGGGGYSGSPTSHRKLAGHLGKAAGSYALVIDYSLVPENSFTSALDDVVAAYHWLLQEGFSSKNIAIAGDSAGGNLAISAVVKLRDMETELPAAISTYSPWVDMEGSGESYRVNVETDALSGPGFLDFLIQLYLGDASPRNPAANPLYANLIGFPPINITAGGAEIMMSDSIKLADVAQKAGVNTTLKVYPGMQHVFQYMAGRSAEANESITRTGTWLQEKWNAL